MANVYFKAEIHVYEMHIWIFDAELKYTYFTEREIDLCVLSVKVISSSVQSVL